MTHFTIYKSNLQNWEQALDLAWTPANLWSYAGYKPETDISLLQEKVFVGFVVFFFKLSDALLLN